MTLHPSGVPTAVPTSVPTAPPSPQPSSTPYPTPAPTTARPSAPPTVAPTPAPTTASPTTSPTIAPTPSPTPGPTACNCTMDYGRAIGDGHFRERGDGLLYGSLPALNVDANTLSDGFGWDDYVAARAYTDGLVIANASYEFYCVYREQPGPTAAPSGAPTPMPSPAPTSMPSTHVPTAPSSFPTPAPSLARGKLSFSSAVGLVGVAPAAVDDAATAAIGNALLACAPALDAVEDVAASRRRRLSANATARASVGFRGVAYEDNATLVAAAAEALLEDAAASLAAAVASGLFAATLWREALCGNQPLVWVVLTKLENSLARSNRSRFG